VPTIAVRVAQIAPLFESVPPDRYGGTERVVASLVDELTRRGHEVTLFASGDSTSDAELVSVTETSLRGDPDAKDRLAPHIGELGMAFKRATEFDIIHCHVDYVAFPASRLSPTPTLHTLHGRLDLPDLVSVFKELDDLPLVSISDAQREPLRELALNWVGTVYHGLRTEDYPSSAEPGRYLAFCGRMSPEKRPDLAIEVAQRAGMPLKILAKVDESERDYFEREIEPMLKRPGVEFLGEVDELQRNQLLSEALALLFPIDWPEPFGLVMIEAMVTGTPVITRPRGAAPEVVAHGRTGFIAESLDDLVAAVKRADTLDRRECRRHVESRFSVRRMVDDYEAVYARL
jgi:glycosyltransferase involved in cell wall biosynthesis